METRSKTQKKKDALHLQELGEKLVNLSPSQLRAIDIPEDIMDAIKDAKKINKHGGLRRQMQFIGMLMRNTDHSPIEEAVHDIENAQHANTFNFKKVETWRDELISGNEPLIEEILNRYPDTDRQQFTQLIRNAKKEVAAEKPPKAYRILFKYLKKIRG